MREISPLSLSAWRTCIALCAGYEALLLGTEIWRLTSATYTSDGFRVFFWFGGSRLAIAGTMALALASCANMIRRPARLRGPALAMLALMVLFNCYAARIAARREHFVQTGATLFGWIVGSCFARAVGVDPIATELEHDEYAGYGAMAVFAATYVCAGIAKLIVGGLGWGIGSTVRLLILAFHRPPDSSSLLVQFALYHPRVCYAIQVATLAIEIGAPIMLIGRRSRLLWGLSIVSLHQGIRSLSGITFVQSTTLALTFAVPWDTARASAQRAVRRIPRAAVIAVGVVAVPLLFAMNVPLPVMVLAVITAAISARVSQPTDAGDRSDRELPVAAG